MRSRSTSKMDELQALSYFSSLTHISRKIALQEKSLIKYLGNKWTEYSPEEKEEILDDLCVPHFIRDEQPPVADDEDGIDRPASCWPTLKLPSGEKIIVDENDIWTWRDEHSGPFSWKSKSQQDLTFLDLEPDNLTKPHGRSHKSSESDEQALTNSSISHLQFVPKHNSWTQAVLDDYFANCCVDVQTPVHTPSSPFESPSEEINPAFEGSVEDLSPSATPSHTAATVPQNNEQADKVVPQTDAQTVADISKGKPKGHRTPSPKKLPHPGLVKKSDGKGGKSGADASHQLLIIRNKDKEQNAFTNPAMEVEWSNFVGQSSTDPNDEVTTHSCSQEVSSTSFKSSASGNHSPSSVVEPTAMIMDRGSCVGGGGGGDSVESTPDHSTKLLKSSAAAVVEEAEKEEVVYVVDDGAGSVNVSSEVVAAPSSPELDTFRSGFDFLDNW